MSGMPAKLRLARALGARSILRVARYRIGLKTGLSPVLRLNAPAPNGPFFAPTDKAPVGAPPSLRWQQEGLLFGHHRIPLSPDPPRFDANPLTGSPWPGCGEPWWRLPDFAGDDIKLVWELSRLPWLAPMAQRIRQGEAGAADRANRWIAAWLRDNPPFTGPNWKCGQEASMRVLNLALAARLSGQALTPQPALLALVDLHLRRIAPTVGYAMGQNNNHGTSEAAALFVGGSWLERCGRSYGRRWARIGRRWLDDRAATLIAADGSFAQYSTVYHRLVLDTYALAELWRRDLDLPPFKPLTRERLRLASRWLRALTDPQSGAVPNLGHNDGTQLFALSDADYRDFRPAVDRATVLFEQRRAFPEDRRSSDELDWLGLSAPAVPDQIASRQFDEGGIALLRSGTARALLRYPRFAFRPAQSDALHLDLWLGERNLIRDAGSYSYNTTPEAMDYFTGTPSHSTIQFDGRNQMPRASRFLFGEWLATDSIEPLAEQGGRTRFGAGYRDHLGARHFRRLELEPGRLMVTDEIERFKDQAVLRWRLAPGAWTLDGHRVGDGTCTLSVTGDMAIESIRLTDGEESLYYLEKHTIPVVEVAVRQPGKLVTAIEWTP